MTKVVTTFPIMQKSALEREVSEIEFRYSQMLSQLQGRVNGLEAEVSQLRADTENQAMEFKRLLDIKTRLEMEIAEYRRLLCGEEEQ